MNKPVVSISLALVLYAALAARFNTTYKPERWALRILKEFTNSEE